MCLLAVGNLVVCVRSNIVFNVTIAYMFRDEHYAYPLTWSYLKNLDFNPIWIFVWVTFNALVVGWIAFLAVSMYIFTYTDLREIFSWECWD